AWAGSFFAFMGCEEALPSGKTGHGRPGIARRSKKRGPPLSASRQGIHQDVVSSGYVLFTYGRKESLMEQSLAVPVVVVLAGSLVAAITDVWKFKVHNLLTVPMFASGLIYRTVVGGWPQFLDGLYGGLFGFGILLILYLLGGMGAGDVKFMAAVGA